MHNKITVYSSERHQLEMAEKKRRNRDARKQFEALFTVSDYERADAPLNLEEKSDKASRQHPDGCTLERATAKPFKS